MMYFILTDDDQSKGPILCEWHISVVSFTLSSWPCQLKIDLTRRAPGDFVLVEFSASQLTYFDSTCLRLSFC